MKPKYQILVAVDFSPCSAAAFREAQRLAAWLGASVTALHVVTPAPTLVPDPVGIGSLAIPLPTDDQLMASARRRWTEFAESCGGAGGARFTIEVGNPRDEILEVVRRERPRMLLVGASGTADAHRGIGTTAAACAQRAATQVMVVRQGAGGPFRSVVACVDFADASRLALEEAIGIATADGSALHILHVYQDPWHWQEPSDEAKRNMPDFAEAYHTALERRVKKFCGPLAHELGALKATIHAVQAPGYADGIKAFISANHCDLAVLGTRGKFNLRDFFWGSTAERVVREALCSVLAVKPRVSADPSRYEPFADTAAVHSSR
jgi:universal stress protein E